MAPSGAAEAPTSCSGWLEDSRFICSPSPGCSRSGFVVDHPSSRLRAQPGYSHAWGRRWVTFQVPTATLCLQLCDLPSSRSTSKAHPRGWGGGNLRVLVAQRRASSFVFEHPLEPRTRGTTTVGSKPLKPTAMHSAEPPGAPETWQDGDAVPFASPQGTRTQLTFSSPYVHFCCQ